MQLFLVTLGLWFGLLSVAFGCKRISVLFALWKLRCKCVFENEVCSLSAFCCMWRDEVHMQLLAKIILLIKDAKLRASAIIALTKRIYVPLFIPFFPLFFTLQM